MIAPRMIQDSLMQLTETAMIRRLDEIEPSYMIKHALVQDTAQATLLKNESKFLHLTVAMALERVNADRLDEYATALAFHYALGEDDSKTLEYSMRAGDVAARVFANREALEHYARAIEIAGRGIATSPQIIELYTKHGRILEVTGNYDAALASYLELHALAEQRGDRSLELAYNILRAPLHSTPVSTFDADLAKPLLLDALGTARELRDEVAEARVLWNLTLLSTHTMHPADALMYGELALSIAERLNLRDQQGYTLHDLFIPYRATGQIESARLVQQQARAIFRETQNQALLADNLGMSAQFAYYEGDLEHALEYSTEGVATSKTIGNPYGVGFNTLFLILVQLECGDNESAIKGIQERSIEIRNSPPSQNPGMTTSMQSWFLGLLGAFSESKDIERLARARTHIPTLPMFQSGQHALLARTRLMHNDIETAAQDLARGLEGYDLGGTLHPGAVHIPLAQAELGLARGDYARVLEDLAAQDHWTRQDGYNLVLAENLLLQGRANLGLGDTLQAIAVLEEARRLVMPIGSRRLEYQICYALYEAERRRGNLAQAEEYFSGARAVLAYILEHTPPDYRAGFMKLPVVREVLSHST